ncbi:MAG TPA: DNA polymerase I [Burkholderiales bacterium]|jgi:DNA polymerase-1|nr:DNA polymerase I [Burkholderiales bacterium]
MKTLLLVDGSSYLYRAFHALPDLRNSKGEPTGAVYGVINMLRRLHKDTRADYSAVVLDAKGKTFRDDIYPEYKATREAMPDDLSSQVEALNETIVAMGWPLLVIDGVEADDVIGTLTKQAERSGMRVIISTGDKDMAQLVSPAVTLVNTMSNETLDVAGVEKKFGVKPERFIDYLSLIGDTIDNIPGVDKVGPKTACKWILQYGSLDEVVRHADEIGGVVGENLRKKLDWLPQARELLTIKCDVPLPVTTDELETRPQDKEKLTRLFERFEFKTWRRELQEPLEEERNAAAVTVPSAITPRSAESCEYETVLTEEQLNAWLLRLEGAELAALDTETTNIDSIRAQLVGISFSITSACAAYVPVGHRYTGAPEQLSLELVLERLKPWLEDARHRKVGQNIKYDMHVLANYGIRLDGVQHDTLLQSYVLESHKSHDMDNLAERHLSLKTITYDDVTGKGARRIPFEQVSVEDASEYAAEDADVTLRLHCAMAPQVEQDQKLCRVYREIEMPVMAVLWQMERNGVLLDVKLLSELSREFGGKMLEIEAKAHEQAGQPFNLNSPRQIQEILFDRNKLPVIKKTPSGTPSTDEDVLAQLALDHPLPKLILEYRGLTKLKSTYTDKLAEMIHPATGRVHTCYSQAVAVTGRLSSSDPNLQNIPIRTAEGRRIREAFIPVRGSQIVSADYSQIELRIMAHISRDESLLRAFAEGRDIHRATASEVFSIPADELSAEQRRYAKAINFGLIYGMSAFGLSRQLDIERSAAQQYMDRYFARYPGVAQYMQRTRELARREGFVETVFGRRLWLPEIRSGSPMRRQAAERAAINAPMQGTAADLIKMAMIRVQDWLTRDGLNAKLIMQVHDELVLEVPDEELERVREELPRLMSGVAELAVPLMVELGVGPNWDKAH